MSTAEQIIAQHLPEYVDGVGMLVCLGCGEASATDREHAAHVVAALTNAGKAIVELPGKPDEEMPENDDEHGYVTWETGVGRATAHTDDTVTVESGYHFSVRPAEARGFAAALLAAARVAEGGERGE